MKKNKPFNKKYLIPIPILIVGVLIYIIFIQKSDFLYAGTIEATKVDISSRIASVISVFHAQEGRRVKEGDLLVEMSCEDLKQNYELAKTDFDRTERLFKLGSLSQENFDHSKARINDTSLKLNWCSLYAVKDATVLNTYREVGEYVTPGTKILTLANLTEVWTIIYVPQALLTKISLGMKITGFLPELEMKSFSGEVTYISDVAEFTPKNVQTRQERTRLVFAVKITFPNSEELLKPGMSLEIKLDE